LTQTESYIGRRRTSFANYGILDQQAVLRWVQENTEAFGGDKDNVTLGGQSAGCVDTESNVMSPFAKGLFHRAIFQSVVLEPSPLATAETKGVAFAVAAGRGSGKDVATAKCLRSLTAQQIFNPRSGPTRPIRPEPKLWQRLSIRSPTTPRRNWRWMRSGRTRPPAPNGTPTSCFPAKCRFTPMNSTTAPSYFPECLGSSLSQCTQATSNISSRFGMADPTGLSIRLTANRKISPISW
jgi:Carboxylesterase family